MSKKNELSTDNWIVKSNALNEIRHSQLTISQSRLFSVYLSKINPQDTNSREVTIKLEEYAKIMQFKRYNITKLKQSAEELTKLVVHVVKDGTDFDPKTGLRGFELTSRLLFNRVKLHKNDRAEWVMSIDCHDDVLPLMFELKSHFFKYKLWNSLQLTSPNQQRMYELLKQYEYIGARELSVKDLRDFLGLEKNEYLRWERFRTRILDASQVALANHTDIKFTYDVIRKSGKGGKIDKLKFHIEKNDNFMQQLTFDDYIQEQSPPVIEGDAEEFEEVNDLVSFLSGACNDEFNREEISLLHSYISKIVPYRTGDWQFDAHGYLFKKYNELNWRAKQTNIKNRFAYLKKIIEADAL